MLAVLALATLLVTGCARQAPTQSSGAAATASAPPSVPTTPAADANAAVYKGEVGADGITFEVRAQRSAEGTVVLATGMTSPGEHVSMVLLAPGVTVDAELSPRGTKRLYTENPPDENGPAPGVRVTRMPGRGAQATIVVPANTRALIVHANVRLLTQKTNPDLWIRIPIPAIPIVTSPGGGVAIYPMPFGGPGPDVPGDGFSPPF